MWDLARNLLLTQLIRAANIYIQNTEKHQFLVSYFHHFGQRKILRNERVSYVLFIDIIWGSESIVWVKVRADEIMPILQFRVPAIP